MKKERIVILGAGLAGLSAAYHLEKLGYNCRLFEKEDTPGGLCRSKKINAAGFTFDYSGHLLHFKHNYTFKLIKDLLGSNIARHKRSAWIYSYGRFSRFPFQANLYGLPAAVAKECLVEFIRNLKNREASPDQERPFKQWIVQTFGKGIARHFMIPYNTKFWTLPTEQLTCGWLDGFIPVPSLGEIIEGTIRENKRLFGYNAHFWYPKKGGIEQLPQALAGRIRNIYTGCRIEEINLAKKEIKIDSGNKEKFDYLISTIPLPELPNLIKNLPADINYAVRKLKWNSIFNLNLGLEKSSNGLRHWIYFPEKKFSFFRVGFPHNFSAHLAPADKSSLYIEIAYSLNKPLDKSNIVARIKKDLKKTGMFSEGQRICAEDVNDIKYAYPIYDVDYRPSREQILKFLTRNNVIPCGRYGCWRYMSMEDVVLDGKRIAEELCA